VVTRRKGAGRALIITPDDPDLFVVAMQERCPSSAPSMAAR